jgi:hypothetical protein
MQYLVSLAFGNFSVIEVIPMIRDPAGLTLNQFSTIIATGSYQHQVSNSESCTITSRYFPDGDGDGLTNFWEAAGGYWNNDGAIELQMEHTKITRTRVGEKTIWYSTGQLMLVSQIL